ncbi:MAG: hypothetical protein MRERV_51c014 [Mycoplasmataceae bacterium RV_VA103A]|nr:MAG: hypothetical protein MRERV_51c014 [Mycoplasmataceae bacterium RV_VA103A]
MPFFLSQQHPYCTFYNYFFILYHKYILSNFWCKTSSKLFIIILILLQFRLIVFACSEFSRLENGFLLLFIGL